MDDDARTRISAHGLCVVDDRVLLVRVAPPLAEAGAWTLPGGGLDWGERPEDALVREVREETGLVAVPSGVAGVFSYNFLRTEARPFPSVHYLSVVYWITVNGTLAHEQEGTSDFAAWIPRRETQSLPLVGLAKYGLGLLP